MRYRNFYHFVRTIFVRSPPELLPERPSITTSLHPQISLLAKRPIADSFQGPIASLHLGLLKNMPGPNILITISQPSSQPNLPDPPPASSFFDPRHYSPPVNQPKLIQRYITFL